MLRSHGYQHKAETDPYRGGTTALAMACMMAFVLFSTVPLQVGTGLLEWAIIFFVLAIIAALVGATGVAGVTMTVAKWFVIIFLILALISIFL